MQFLDLKQKTGIGIVNPNAPVTVWDYRDIIFYSTEDMLKQGKVVYRFNLPAGKYTIDSDGITMLAHPITQTKVILPPRERSYPDPTNFRVVFGNNKNKCSIIWDKQLILFDESLKQKPLPVLDFILAHEFGHSRYATEALADLWAANYLLDMGYNKSQIGLAPMVSLSHYQDNRKISMVEKLTNKKFEGKN